MTETKQPDHGTAITREIRRQELSEMEFDTIGQRGGFMVPRNGRELLDMANLMASSDFMVKDMYRNNSGACAGLIMVCARFGLDPFAVSWKTYKASKSADAPISYEAQLVNAMINTGAPIRGRLKATYSGKDGERRCKIIGTAEESNDVLEYESPPFATIQPKNSPLWKSDPDQQLFYFSSRAWCRRHFPEIMLGVYARDELEEAPPMRTSSDPKDITPEAQSLAARIAKQRTGQSEPVDSASEASMSKVVDAEVVEASEQDGSPEPSDKVDATIGKPQPETDESDDGDLFDGQRQ